MVRMTDEVEDSSLELFGDESRAETVAPVFDKIAGRHGPFRLAETSEVIGSSGQL